MAAYTKGKKYNCFSAHACNPATVLHCSHYSLLTTT